MRQLFVAVEPDNGGPAVDPIVGLIGVIGLASPQFLGHVGEERSEVGLDSGLPISGGDAIQVSLGLPAATVQVFNGMLLVCLIAGNFFLANRVQVRSR